MPIYTPSMWNEKDRRTDDLVPAAKKLEAPYLVTKMDQLIGSLVRSSDRMLETSLRYMNAERDSREFALLTKNYGLGNPLKLGFIPLMERHVKALQGQFQEYPFPFSIAVTDRDSINLAAEEWASEATRRVAQLINEAVRDWNPGAAAEPAAGPGGQPAAAPAAAPPTLSARALEQIAEDGESFQSHAQVLAQRLVEGMVNRYHLKNEVSEFVTHYCVGSRLHYRAWLPEKGRLCEYTIFEPGMLHYDRSQRKKPIRERGRVVLHERVTRAQALAEHGHLMNDEERNLISGRKQGGMDGVEWIPLRPGQEVGAPSRLGKDNGTSAPTTDGNYFDALAVRRAGLNAGDMDQLIDRYHCEWIATNDVDDIEDSEELTDDQLAGQAGVIEFGKAASKKAAKNESRRRMDRYEGWRYGNSIYLAMGRSTSVVRSVDDPFTCYLTYNGIDLNSPSLVYKGKDLQDKYDILSYQQDNLIAQGGVPGVAMDINDIPMYLDPKSVANRVLKYRALIKSGFAPTDRNQSGSGSTEPGVAPPRGEINNTMGKIDTSFSGPSVAAIQNQMSQLEERASMLSGVPRQMLAEIKERDGKGTTQQAMDSAAAVSRPMYTVVYGVVEQLLTDMLNLNVLSAQSNPFVLQSLIGSAGVHLLAQTTQGIPLADYNVTFEDPMEEKQILDRVRQAGQILAQNQAVDPESILDTAATKSSVELMFKLRKNLNKKTQQTINDLQDQLTQLGDQLKQAQAQVQQFDQAKMALEQQKVQTMAQVGIGGVQNQQQANANTAAFNSEKIALEKKRIDLEEEQLYAEAANGPDELGGAAEIKND